MANEKERVDEASSWYLNGQLEFDKKLIHFRYRTLKPFFVGESCLEVGPAEGSMTYYLKDDFLKLTVVEGAKLLLDKIPQYPNLTKVHSLFEDFHPTQKFTTIVMEHILEHVDDPVALLKAARNWIAEGGHILVGVPNGLSFHRLAAVKMGLLSHPCQLNDRDLVLGHRRVYTFETFETDIRAAGLKLNEMGGVYFKPLSNSQIETNWSAAMVEGFYELGKDFPRNAAEIYAVCKT